MHRTTTVAVLLVAFTATSLHAQALRGSSTSVDRQYSIALQHDYTFLTRSTDVNRFIELGLLVPIKGNRDYAIHAVSFPYGRPAVRTFVERLAAQYRSSCGEQLVVTSLTRPKTRQPGNASSQSVHPAGMAVDLRIPSSSCRRWLESTLLSLEKTGVLEATRERNPAHYHVAVFPTQYLSYVNRIAGNTATPTSAEPKATTTTAATTTGSPATATASTAVAAEPPSTATGTIADNTAAGTAQAPDGSTSTDQTDTAAADDNEPATPATYRVRRGDSLWSIARANATTIADIKRVNGIRSNAIKAGQTLTIPTPSSVQQSYSATTDDGAGSTTTYRVRRGDSLWSIARAHSTTVDHIRQLNGFSGSRIKAGQIVTVPTGR